MKLRGASDICASFLVKTFMQGIKNVVPQVAGLLPINMPILVRLNRAVIAIISCSYEKNLLVTMFTVMYFALFENREGSCILTWGTRITN